MGELLIFWAIVWICKNAAEDVMYAAKGRTSPRRARQLKRLEESGGKPGYGARGYLSDFWDDFLRERTEKRREVRAKRDEVTDDEWKQGYLAAAAAWAREPTGFTPQAQDPPQVTHTTPDPDDDARRVDPLGLDGRDHHQPRIGEVHHEDGTQAQYRWDGTAWVKTHNADGTEIPLCPSCGRRRYRAYGDGCGNCRPADATAQVIPIFRIPESTPTQEVQNMSEVTGLDSAIAYAHGVAHAHEAHAADAEAFTASLASNDVGDGTLGLVGQAQEASSSAAASWSSVADELEHQRAVKEAYESNPDAGSKEFVTSE